MKNRLSQLQRLVLKAVAEYPPFDGEAPYNYVAWEVARVHKGENIWDRKKRMDQVYREYKEGKTSAEEAELVTRLIRGIASTGRGRWQVLSPKFSASLSRSIVNLESKGLLEVGRKGIRRWDLLKNGHRYYGYWLKLTALARGLVKIEPGDSTPFWAEELWQGYPRKIARFVGRNEGKVREVTPLFEGA